MSTDTDLVISSPRRVSLNDYDPGDTAGVTEEQAAEHLPRYQQRLTELQDLLYGAEQHGALIVLQGMDTSGKDGTIKHVMSQINPSGCQVVSFKVPTEEELRHDFLWRVHQHTPARGMMAIFNRSHYEDVVTARVHQLITKADCRRRYRDINAFERLAHHNGTLVLKFFLFISKEEQRRRLLAREEGIDKAWKLSVADWRERQYWDSYQTAYQKALGHCASSWAPWYIIPADHKWYRNYLVAKTIISRLAKHESSWKDALRERGEAQLRALQEAHLPDREEAK